MTLLIKSEDHTTGTLYNGTWTLTRAVQGNFSLITQTMDAGGIPFMWSANNSLRIRFPFETNYYVLIHFTTDLCNTDNYADIATQWQADIQSELDDLAVSSGGDMQITCTVTYNEAGYWSFVLEGNEGEEDGVVLLFEDPLTTCGVIFDQSSNLSSQNTFHLPNTYTTPYPKYLECIVEEANSYLLSTHQTSSSLILSTDDLPITGQFISFRNGTSTLTIQLYRPNDREHPVPSTLPWLLFFQ